ncbi:MAG: Bug family tripartite tricarboxylate transporter substrate binding protein [Burkholderiales bacterium]
MPTTNDSAWKKFRFFPLAICGAFCLGAALAAQAQAPSWPARAVKVIATSPPGGGIDLMTRLVAEEAAKSFGQPFVVENRPGANGNIGTQAALREPADGHVFFVSAPGPFAINQSFMSAVPFNAASDIAPVAMLGSLPLMLVLHPSIPANNVQELLAWMKSRGNKVTYASQGIASTGHLAMELFLTTTGMEATHIPYKNSGANAAIDHIAGRIDIAFNSSGATLQYLEKKQLRAIAVGELKRIAMAPHIPTIVEQGIPGFEVTPWIGVGTRAGVPGEIIRRMNDSATRGMARAENRERLMKMGFELRPMTPEQFAAYIRAETLKWGELIRRTGVKEDT